MNNQRENHFHVLQCASCDYPIGIALAYAEIVDGQQAICPNCGVKGQAVHSGLDLESKYYKLSSFKLIPVPVAPT